MACLSNLFLDRFLSPLCKNFIGTFAVDTLPSNLWNTSCCAIVNLSVSTHPGSHFIAFFINKQNYLYYFDSYALPIPAYNHHLINFQKKWVNCGRIRHVLDRSIQAFDSLFCGWYAAAFCMFVNAYANAEPRHFCTFFNPSDLRENEKCVKHLVKRLQVVLY